MKLSNAQADTEMTYYDSAKDKQISYQRAMQELKKHDLLNFESITDFERMLGKKDFYSAQDVLRWLGY